MAVALLLLVLSRAHYFRTLHNSFCINFLKWYACVLDTMDVRINVRPALPACLLLFLPRD